MFRHHYTDNEINEILKTLTIVMDTREKQASHILEYFNKKGVPVKIQKLDIGDYSAMIPANETLGIKRDVYLNSFVERKAHIDEITGNLQKDKQQAFINELIRSQGNNFVLFVEDPLFDRNLAQGKYRSKYDPKALRGRLDSLQAKYNFEIRPVEKDMMGHVLYHRFFYQARHLLKTGSI